MDVRSWSTFYVFMVIQDYKVGLEQFVRDLCPVCEYCLSDCAACENGWLCKDCCDRQCIECKNFFCSQKECKDAIKACKQCKQLICGDCQKDKVHKCQE